VFFKAYGLLPVLFAVTAFDNTGENLYTFAFPESHLGRTEPFSLRSRGLNPDKRSCFFNSMKGVDLSASLFKKGLIENC